MKRRLKKKIISSKPQESRKLLIEKIKNRTCSITKIDREDDAKPDPQICFCIFVRMTKKRKFNNKVSVFKNLLSTCVFSSTTIIK
jgi:hypothetical protein